MILACEGLTVERGGTAILDGVTASLIPGDITAICGPNGAGKSTLLSTLAHLMEPAAGSVTLSNKPVGAMHPLTRARNIGYLPQTGEVAWDVAVRDLVALGRLPHRDAGEAEVRQAIGICDLDDLAHRPVSTLSGGEKARALLARVLAGQPQWILADEPLAALDLAHQLAMLRVLRSEAEAGCGVVLVLHDLALAMNHADRVLVLDKGRLVADGIPEEALSGGTIREVWGVDAHWIGEEGARALVY
ncbi:ABC transporter ATP-binding protein [Erythrobacter sp. EC-HK427]|uniref:ABC transporter ATP-binding protein n=1 Tax=Erythrobacter sp. EC-HK427 TaxID=2038396 RepID=UPI001254354A|nr:ABC transporter ATP-binding protein [Erythrobacter sp. EC-HK427]VVT12610.1 Ferrichrome ABC transporter ATP-binding protein [Erythrobacter sp. EC-HK427]